MTHSGRTDLTVRPLEPTDEPVVRSWLKPYLEQHLAWWRAAYGAAPKIPVAQLVTREWQGLVKASDAPEQFVGVAVAGLEAVGVVLAATQDDHYLGIKVGVLGWLYVVDKTRGQGVSSVLMTAADAWMQAQQVEGRQVYVTTDNRAAVKVYERFGYRAVDARMLGAAPAKVSKA